MSKSANDSPYVKPDDLGKLAGAVSVPMTPVSFDTVFVTMRCSEVLTTVSDMLANAFAAVQSLREVDSQLLLKSMFTVLASRVKSTGGEVVDGNGKPINFPVVHFNERGMAYPAVWLLLVNQVGRVTDVMRGIELIPRLITTESELCSKEELIRSWSWFREFGKVGLDTADSYSREHMGDIDFMTFQVVDDLVLHDKAVDPPVKAMFAGLVIRSALTNILIPRVRYFSVNVAGSHMSSLFQPKANKGRQD
jgi:hypothetical protein